MAIKKLSKEYFDEICDVMSYDRLKRYRELLSEDLWHTGIVFIPYFVIQEASSMLLPTIQLVEIAMRNRIDKAIVNYYTQNYIGKQPDEWYFWIAEDDRTQRAINDAIERAEKETKGEGSFESKLGWGPLSVSIKGSASYSSRDSSTHDTHYEKSNSAKYTINVHAGQLPVPKGVNTIIEAFTQAIQPIEMPVEKDKDTDDTPKP